MRVVNTPDRHVGANASTYTYIHVYAQCKCTQLLKAGARTVHGARAGTARARLLACLLLAASLLVLGCCPAVALLSSDDRGHAAQSLRALLLRHAVLVLVLRGTAQVHAAHGTGGRPAGPSGAPSALSREI